MLLGTIFLRRMSGNDFHPSPSPVAIAYPYNNNIVFIIILLILRRRQTHRKYKMNTEADSYEKLINRLSVTIV